MKSWFSISGRIARREYWIRTLTAWAILMTAAGISSVINPDPETVTTLEMWTIFPIYLVAFWIVFSARVQRMHDRGKSGFWLLLIFVPIIGELWLFIELGFLEGDSSRNMYGEPAVRMLR